MKILLINHFPLNGSGSGVYTKNVANSLVKAGHEVCIIMPENQIVPTEEGKVKIHPVYFNGGNNIKGELNFNFPCFTTHPRSVQTFYDLSDTQYEQYKQAFDSAIKEEIEEFKPEVIHVGHIWTLAAIASKYNLPLVITAHGTDLIGYEKSIESAQRYIKDAELAYAKASKVITISKENEVLVNKIFPNNCKTVLISNGYDSSIFYKQDYNRKDVLAELGVNKEYNKIVCFVGKFAKFKGIDILLEALDSVDVKDTLVLLAGNGELFEEMKAIAEKSSFSDIVFLGNQPQDMLRKIYNISDVSIVPSRNEPFGLVVIEALACGTPVIGSNNGGIINIIKPDIGILFEAENSNDLAKNITEVLLEKRRFDSEYIANYTKEKYSQDNFTNQLVEIYKGKM